MKDFEKMLGVSVSDKLQAGAFAEVTPKVFNEQQLEKELQEQAAELSALYAMERSQVIEACKADLNFLAPLALPDVFEVDFPPVLLLVWQMVTAELQKRSRGFPKLALGIPRGHAKTTLVKLLILYIILFTDKKYVLVISSIEKKAIAIISDVISMLEEDNIVRTFGRWDVSCEIDQQATKKFYFQGRWIVLYGTGALGDVRGTNLGNARPDVMIFEDMQTREAAMSEVQSTAIEGWMYATAMKAKSPHGCLYLFVANMYPTEHSILRKLKNNPKWIKFISGAILSDGSALWEEVHPLEALMEEFEHDTAAGKPEAFLAEVQNETNMAAFNRSVDLSKFRCRERNSVDYIVRAKFVVIDPATGKRAEGLDDVGIGYFETIAEAPQRPIAVDMVLLPLTPLQTILASLNICIKNKCRVIGVESNAYQQTYLFWFNFVCERLGISGFHLVEIYSNSQSKNARVDSVIKAFIAGEIETSEGTHAAITKQAVEYDFTKTKNKDEALDLCAFSIGMVNNHQAFLEAMDPSGLAFAEGSPGVGSLEDTCPF